ncbi:MAG: dihydroorotate dehydrogenase electron transfer subunit [Nitrospirales bacterium]|nr:dihydroorotate dehydrogenase electron transfer subunit [Nitrospirales bacterium]
MYKDIRAEIIGQEPINQDFRLLTVRPRTDFIPPRPGQFYMLQVGETLDPLLKRPLSIFDWDNGTLRFLYRIRGKGTGCLSSLRTGEIIQLIGPLGNGYEQPEGAFIAVAGGIGMASLFPLLKNNQGKGYLFYGARTRDELIMVEESRSFVLGTLLSTDVGHLGHKGVITELLLEFLSTEEASMPIYACGPTPMMKELGRIASERGIKTWLSLEEHMACGIGACLGCVVKTPSGYKRVCKEGPVFSSEEVLW